MDVEVLLADDWSVRGKKIMQAMMAGAPSDVRIIPTHSWEHRAPVLMSYGLGHPMRKSWIAEHRKQGGRVIGWDLGYWHRDVPGDFMMRLTIDDDHPAKFIEPEPGDRFDRAGIALRDDYRADGPIILCGMGAKQRRYKGLGKQEWERKNARRLALRFPDREILYRPKKPEEAPFTLRTSKGSIEKSLRGASLLVCSHSNVAVDACIAGVPVECEDGAARALYSARADPSREERLGFLRSLAWWQWNCSQAPHAWDFIKRQLGRTL